MGDNPGKTAIVNKGHQHCVIEDTHIYGKRFGVGVGSPPGCGVSETRMVSPMPSCNSTAMAAVEATMPLLPSPSVVLPWWFWTYGCRAPNSTGWTC